MCQTDYAQPSETVGFDMAVAGRTVISAGTEGAHPGGCAGGMWGPEVAGPIDRRHKAGMSREAERLLAGSGWLPEPL